MELERKKDRKKEREGQSGTFGFWGSLVGPVSSFTSALGFPSELIMLSPDIPIAPSPRMRKQENICAKFYTLKKNISMVDLFFAHIHVLVKNDYLQDYNEWIYAACFNIMAYSRFLFYFLTP